MVLVLVLGGCLTDAQLFAERGNQHGHRVGPYQHQRKLQDDDSLDNTNVNEVRIMIFVVGFRHPSSPTKANWLAFPSCYDSSTRQIVPTLLSSSSDVEEIDA